MLRSISFTGLLLLWVGSAGAQTQGGPLGVPLPLFPPDNWWNVDVSGAPLDSNSAAFIIHIGGAGRSLHPDFGGRVDPGTNSTDIYGFPYIVVNSTQPTRTVLFDYADESDPGPYPIPAEAITLGHWIEGGQPGNQQPGGDRHMLIVDKDQNRLYELYNVRYLSGAWEAGSGAIWDMGTNNVRPEGWTSADAAGLQILPGLIRHDEADPGNPDEIGHAFRVTVQNSNGHVYPATHTAGSTAGALPMGARLRLKASVDIAGFSAEAQKIYRAMKKYGLIVADNGSNMFISGTFDTAWESEIDGLVGEFAQLTADDFEVVELGWNPPPVPLPTLSIDSVSDTEGDSGTTAFDFTVTLSEAATGPVMVRYATANGTATTANGDYVATSGRLTFDPGVTTQTISVLVNGDIAFEGDETFVVNLSTPSAATIDVGQGTGTIQNDDPPPSVSVEDASVTEGDVGQKLLLFAVSLSAPSSQTATVAYATSDQSATAGSDYGAASGVITFLPGVTARTVAIAVAGDTAAETDETFSLDLASPVNTTIGSGQAIGTILDDDALPSLSIADASVVEGNSGTTNAVFTVTLSPASVSPVTVSYATADGTARAGSDYQATSGSVSFAPTATTATISVAVVGDTLREKNEAFLVQMASPSGAKLVRAQAQGVIRDNDGRGDACNPIVTVPITLATPGLYCLSVSLTTTIDAGAAITIGADGVTLDLKGLALRDLTSGTQAYGVWASGRKNVTVRNGTLRGFFSAVSLEQAGPYSSPQGLLVTGVKAVESSHEGIRIEGQGNRIQGNQVTGTHASGVDADAFGIVAVGPAPRIFGNLVSSTEGAGAGAAYGISITGADAAQVSHNRVNAASVGILVDASAGVTVNANRLTTLDYGIVFAAGATGTYLGNTFAAVETPYVGGTPGP
jgi:hypothetical protein